jgi:hypothetical protein
MKKRIIAFLTVILLAVGILPVTASAASGSLSNFTRVNTYQSGHFQDVSTSGWYAAYVQTAYEYGLVNGKTLSAYEPDASLTVAEAVKLAVCLHNIYYTGTPSVSNNTGSGSWYQPYTEAALTYGIITAQYSDYNAPITRSDFALILSRSLPDEALAVRNTVDTGVIPDVALDASYCGAVYKLYRAGVLTGSDAAGRFLPGDNIKRSEVATIVTRMANTSFRKTLTLKLELTTTQIYDQCAPAVIYIEITDMKGTKIKTGSGFFISDTGIAVTNYHVIVGAASATVTAYDGKQYNVTGVYGYDEKKDLALIQVDGTGFRSLALEDSNSLVVGENTYAIGSPLGYKNTISAGIISGLGRVVDGKTFIQTTAAISPGSSGGALLNGSGKVIGVTTATATGAQNLNLAAPSNDILTLDRTKLVTLASILPDTKYYEEHYPVADFGAVTGTTPYKTETKLPESYIYYYKTDDINKTMSADKAFDAYAALLEQNTFSYFGYSIADGHIITYYLNGAYGMLVTFGEVEVDGVSCVRVEIMCLT